MLWVGLRETENHNFDKHDDAPIGRGKTKKQPVIDHENKRLIFVINKVTVK